MASISPAQSAVLDTNGLRLATVPNLLICLSLATLSLVKAVEVDYAESRQAEAWLRHPVYGDPSFDSFERLTGNPVHRGAPPFEWPVNGFFFPDPRSRNWYIYVGSYGKGYGTPPSQCLLYRSPDGGATWTNLGCILRGDSTMFDKGGHTPDASVVCEDGTYHMVYDWGEPDFNAEGGIAYASASTAEGPWIRAREPITRNSTLSPLLGRYQRTYAATLVRRRHDWAILAMMDRAPHSWALFIMTSANPGGPYSERRLVRHVEADYFHPPLMEFFPAFVHQGYVYAPATSVALNRNFNALFRAPLEKADQPSAWNVYRHGGTWHSEDVENEHFGIWGQTYSGAVEEKGVFTVMFPSRDRFGNGTINLARRRWVEPFRKRGFILSGHAGPALTLLQRSFQNYSLQAELKFRGKIELLLDSRAPLGPNAAASDATLHPLSSTRQVALQLGSDRWTLVHRGADAGSVSLASGQLRDASSQRVSFERTAGKGRLHLDGSAAWEGDLPVLTGDPSSGQIGLRVEANSHLDVEQFRVEGNPQSCILTYLHTEGMLGAGASPQEWRTVSDPIFRFGVGLVAEKAQVRAKWNVTGNALTLWCPRGPGFGRITICLDGQLSRQVDLESPTPRQSLPVWDVGGLRTGPHVLSLVAVSGQPRLDCLDVTADP